MPFPYISHPKSTLEKDCIVYPLSPSSGVEAYMIYSTSSGVDRWRELYAKIEAESDALRGAQDVYPFVILADEREELRNELSEQFEQYEREHSSLREFTGKLGRLISSLAQPVGIDLSSAPAGMCWNFEVISDKNLGDNVIVMIIVLPVNIGKWALENGY